MAEGRRVMSARQVLGDTNLFVASENDEAAAARLPALRGTQCPEGNWTTAILGEPTLQLALGGIVWQAAEVKDLGALAKESSHIAASIEWASHYARGAGWVIARRSRLLNE
ncbi:hypothetical protein Tdes44962_MAKER02137 [Teratosphaeria destructans]|uniref:Uncharacterized protein n=1 Tax=Teratosphaeria destructans TaxID=418781 RepID=A0A9W7SUU4_9PEZI|nr:hypothetical protein Tdes44962_MAKER02137 [Teratosphaeria destructans]